MDINRFKDSQGRWLTASLFYEKSYNDTAIYSMKTEDSNGLPSFRRRYMEIADPTEYRVASELVGGWEHWQVLNSSQWFSDFIKPLREELHAKLMSDILIAAYKLGSSAEKGSVAAAKFFKESIEPVRGRGRPSKAEVQEEAKRQANIRNRLIKDAERIDLNLVVDND